jgi:hypothetical protein
MAGWGRRNRTTKWRFQKRILLPVREKLQNRISSEFISCSKHSNFENRTESAESRALERIEPFGEEWRALPLEVRNSNQKLLSILGSIANILAQRTGCCGEVAEGEELGSNLLRVSQGLAASPLAPQRQRREGPESALIAKTQSAMGSLCSVQQNRFKVVTMNGAG